jgi:cobalt-zinc-cadmium efflux system outer membrane protein
MFPKQIVVLALLNFVLIFSVSAQTPQTQPQSLSLNIQQAIQYTMEHNPGVVVLQKRRAIAEAEIRVAEQWNNPALITEYTRSQPNYFVGAGYLLELGGKRQNRIAIAKGEADLAQLALTSGLRTLRHDIRVAFYEAFQSQERMKQITLSRDLADKLLEVTKERFEAGDVAKFEVLQTELETKRRENELKEAESESKSALVELNTFLNRKPEAALQLDGALEEKPTIPPLETLVNQAISQHIEIQSIQQELTTEEARLALAKSERIPDLDLEGGTEINDADFQYGWRAALRLELPLFNQRKGEIERSNAATDNLKAELEAAKQKTRAEIEKAYLKVDALQKQVETYRKEILPGATEIEKLSQESYHEGKTGLLSAIDAQRNMHEVRLEYINVLMSFQTAIADLEQASGVELQ